MRKTVESSSFASVGYVKQSATLEVEFLDGEVYRYFDVPASVYEQLMKSESKGSFFHQEIKNVYRFTRV